MSWLRSEVARAPRLYASILLVIVAAGAYANTLQGAFHFDDLHHIVGNPYLRDAKYAQQYLHRPDMFSALPGHNMYRPTVLWSFHLNYLTGGYDPLHWRLTAIALHALTAVGVFLTGCVLAGCFLKRPDLSIGAFVAALLFAVHPVFSETVNYASARSSLLATCTLIWAYWAHQQAQSLRRRSRLPLMLFSLVLLSASLLSKEVAVVFPALLLWTAVVRRGGTLAVLPSVVIVGAYLLVRQALLGSAVIDFGAREAAMAAADAGSGGARPILLNLYTQARVVCAYLLLFVAPFGLCIHRSVRVSESPFEAGVIGGALVIVALLVTAWRLRERRPVVSLGIMWFLIALSPTSSIIPLNQVMNEHRLYLPGVGMALLLGALLCGPRMRRITPFAAVVLAALTLSRNLDWGDSVRLWRSAVEVSPDSDGAWNALGAQLRRTGDLDGAERAFRRSLEINPRSWGASFNMGTLYLTRGRSNRDRDRDLREAQRWLELSLELRPGAQRSRWYLAEVLYAMGRPAQAAQAFGALAGLNPRLHEMTRYPLARIALDRGDLAGASQLYSEALRHGTDPVAALLGQARVALREGEPKQAVGNAKRAMETRPHNPQPHLFLARLHKGTPAAVRHLFQAERRGYRPTEKERRTILGERYP